MESKSEVQIRAIIADDEELARRILREYLAAHPDITVVAECANGFDAVKAASELQPDLLFLDIQMPRLDGFEVVELLEENLAVIFVTAYDEFALKAFEVHAVDYLLKPFSPERLAVALDRIRRNRSAAPRAPYREMASAVQAERQPCERILVKNGSTVVVIPVHQVDYIEAQDDYVKIVAGAAKHLKQQTLSHLEAELDSSLFVRVHRSFILNIEKIQRIEPYARDSRVAILKDGTQISLSKSGYAKLKQLL